VIEVTALTGITGYPDKPVSAILGPPAALTYALTALSAGWVLALTFALPGHPKSSKVTWTIRSYRVTLATGLLLVICLLGGNGGYFSLAGIVLLIPLMAVLYFIPPALLTRAAELPNPQLASDGVNPGTRVPKPCRRMRWWMVVLTLAANLPALVVVSEVLAATDGPCTTSHSRVAHVRTQIPARDISFLPSGGVTPGPWLMMDFDSALWTPVLQGPLDEPSRGGQIGATVMLTDASSAIYTFADGTVAHYQRVPSNTNCRTGLGEGFLFISLFPILLISLFLGLRWLSPLLVGILVVGVYAVVVAVRTQIAVNNVGIQASEVILPIVGGVVVCACSYVTWHRQHETVREPGFEPGTVGL
jgi:hypothetical protein